MEFGEGLRETLDAERALMPADVYEIGSMLSYDERLLLHWAARTAPDGAVVDLGSFFGGSTLALARGAEARGGTVDAFDLWICRGEIENTWAPPGSDLSLGDRTRHVFEGNIAAVADRVAVHEGDIREQRWNAPISVLMVDVTKGWGSGDAVWRTFLPWVREGGLVIQQDLVHWGHPWCAIVMEHLSEHFEYLGWTWYSSAVYRCVRPPEDVPVPLVERLDCQEMLALLDRAGERFGWPLAASLRLSGAFVFAAYERFDEARARVDEIRTKVDDTALPYIEEGIAYADEWLADAEAGRTPILKDIEVAPAD
jgi:hypothetical protein